MKKLGAHFTEVTRGDFKGLVEGDAQVMHMTSGEFDGEMKEKRQDLINKYVGDVFRDNKLRLLKGRASDPRDLRQQPQPPEPIQNMRASENKGLSTEPFLNLLQLPRTKRPSTLQECINFFYPTSSVFSKSKDFAPFTSTSLTAYSFGEGGNADAGNIPLFLGDVSMMYGWFLIYRQMLCPITFPTNEVPTFKSCSDEFFTDPQSASQLNSAYKDEVGTLSLISSGFDLLRTAYEMSDSADFDFEEMLDWDIGEVGEFLAQGLSGVSDILVGELLVSPEFSNDIASFIVNGIYDPSAYSLVKNLPDTNKTYLALKEFAIDKLKLSNITDPMSQKRLSDFVFTGNVDDINGGYGSLGQTEKGFVDDRLQDLEERYLSDFTSFSGKTINPPTPRPRHLGFAFIATAILTTAIKGGLDYHKEITTQNFQGNLEYLKTHLKCLSEEFQDPNIQFAFMTHIRSGKWQHEPVPWLKGEWNPGPYCEVQQGGQILRYWEYVWENFITYIRSTNDKYLDMIKGNGFLSATLSNYDTWDLPPITYPDGDKCRGTELLANTSFASTIKVIEKLRDFSPFTHAYGFAPVINFNATNAQGQRYIYLDGSAQRSYLGSDYGKFNQWGNTYDINKTRGGENNEYLRAHIAPNRSFPYSSPPPSSDWNLANVEKFLQRAPLGSRRQLNGEWQGRTSVSFDVGLGDDAPVMDAQFCAFISVLFCYREAVETFKKTGPQWAKYLETYTPKVNLNKDLERYMRGREFGVGGEHLKVKAFRKKYEKILSKLHDISKRINDITASDTGALVPKTAPKINKVVAYASIITALGGAGLLINKLRKFNP